MIWLYENHNASESNCWYSKVLFEAPWMRWRRFDFGQLATLLMLETRLWARTSQAAAPDSNATSFGRFFLRRFLLEAEMTTAMVYHDILGQQHGKCISSFKVVQLCSTLLPRLLNEDIIYWCATTSPFSSIFLEHVRFLYISCYWCRGKLEGFLGISPYAWPGREPSWGTEKLQTVRTGFL